MKVALRTLLMSDVHIGFKFSRAEDAVRVLEKERYDRLILVLQEYTKRLAGLKLCREYTYESGGKKIVCVHGDQFDSVTHGIQRIGDFLYNMMLHLNSVVAWVRSLFGLRYWSLSKWCKDKVKNTINKAFSIEDKLRGIDDADVVVYGHTHMPHVSDDLVNTGTFVEIATYIIEKNGKFKLKDLDSNWEKKNVA